MRVHAIQVRDRLSNAGIITLGWPNWKLSSIPGSNGTHRSILSITMVQQWCRQPVSNWKTSLSKHRGWETLEWPNWKLNRITESQSRNRLWSYLYINNSQSIISAYVITDCIMFLVIESDERNRTWINVSTPTKVHQAGSTCDPIVTLLVWES